MKQAIESIKTIKQSITDMFNLVESQAIKAETALLNCDRDLANEIIYLERKVDAFELIIDRECEKFLALQTPVAVDMRLIISMLKINGNLERIGDFAAGIAQFTLHDQNKGIDPIIAEKLQIRKMFDEAINMLRLCKSALFEENSSMAAKVFAKDDLLDDINREAVPVLADLIRNHNANAEQMLYLYSVIRKLERMGDHCNNIAEEIIFYIDAKVMKHRNMEQLKDEVEE